MNAITLPHPRQPRARRPLLWLVLAAAILAASTGVYVKSAGSAGVPIIPCKTCAKCECPKTLGALKCLCPR